MRRTLLSAILFACLCLCCGKADLSKFARVDLPPIPDGEVTEYQVLSGDEQIGIYLMTTRRVDFRGASALRLDVVSKTMQGDIPTIDSSTVFVTRDSLRPLGVFRFVRTGAALVTTAANYAPGSVAIATYTPQEEKQRMLPVGQFAYDADQLNALGRAIRLPTTGKPIDVQVVSPMGPPVGGAVFDGKFGIAGDETVSVPAGTFDCYKLILNMGQHVIGLWYEKTGSRRMVRYATPGGGLVMELLPPGSLARPADQP
jgi:hypothetical protein